MGEYRNTLGELIILTQYLACLASYTWPVWTIFKCVFNYLMCELPPICILKIGFNIPTLVNSHFFFHLCGSAVVVEVTTIDVLYIRDFVGQFFCTNISAQCPSITVNVLYIFPLSGNLHHHYHVDWLQPELNQHSKASQYFRGKANQWKNTGQNAILIVQKNKNLG